MSCTLYIQEADEDKIFKSHSHNLNSLEVRQKFAYFCMPELKYLKYLH